MMFSSYAKAYRLALADMSKWRVARYALFPPSALYAPVFDVVPLAEDGRLVVEAECAHRYPGPYEIGVKCAKRIDNPVPRIGKVCISASFFKISGELVARIEREASQASCPWWDGTDRNGFSLACYAVPAEVPVRERLRCRVETFDLDGSLAHYQLATIYSRCVFRA